MDADVEFEIEIKQENDDEEDEEEIVLVDNGQQSMQDVLRVNASGDLTVEWNFLEKDLPGVVLHDRLMTDAALGHRPIKAEHSYSLNSDGDSLPDSPISSQKMDEMDEECFPTVSMSSACGRLSETVTVKDEPVSETDSTHSSCPPSPQSNFLHLTESMDTEVCPPNLLKHSKILQITTTDGSTLFTTQRIPKLNIKVEPGSAFHLPPTPPSCSSSSEDSEDNTPASRSVSPSRKTLMASSSRSSLGHSSTTTRQPIHTPLISSQPKGSTGTLILTEEEKRTLIAEGYPVPTRLPLTKAEEKSLKKIRRKIKNKISAQESRRKKKEYMDQLERKVQILVTENGDYRKKIESLEDSNASLMNQLAKLQQMVARTNPQLLRQMKQQQQQ